MLLFVNEWVNRKINVQAYERPKEALFPSWGTVALSMHYIVVHEILVSSMLSFEVLNMIFEKQLVVQYP